MPPLPLDRWLAARTYDAPGALRERVLAHAADSPSSDDPAHTLASAGQAALARVVSRPGDRTVALDLLAADGLITLALLWRAEHAPATLGALARALTAADGTA